MEEKGWDRIRNKIPEGYEWTKQWGKEKNEKGKAMGDIIVGIREEMMERARERGGIGGIGDGDKDKGEGGGTGGGRSICEWRYGKEAETHKAMYGETE